MLRSVGSVLLASIVLPPVGLVLLWLRSGTRAMSEAARLGAIAGWTVGYLVLFFGLHFQLDGSGYFPRPVFGRQGISLRGTRAKPRSAAAGSQGRGRGPPMAAVVEEPAVKQPERKPVESTGPISADRNRDGRYDQTPVLAEWPKADCRKSGAAGRRRLCVVRGREWARVHHRAAPPSGSRDGLRHGHRTRAVGARMGWRIPGIDGRRRTARDSHLA